ncbi:MobA/MobL family protein, partial [Ancylomarina longa]
IFWQCADEYERKNGSTYREIEIALPRELTPQQRKELVQTFVEQELGEQHAYTWAIHTPKASIEGGEQPHAHIMYSERLQDGIERSPDQFFKRYNSKNPERGGCQKSNTAKTAEQRKTELVELRERFADLQNAYLEEYGHADRVDHRSLADQGIERS